MPMLWLGVYGLRGSRDSACGRNFHGSRDVPESNKIFLVSDDRGRMWKSIPPAFPRQNLTLRPVESGFWEKLVSNQKKNVMFARSEAIIGRVYDGDLLQNSLQEDCFYYSRLLPTEGWQKTERICVSPRSNRRYQRSP